jgi:transcriptional regulator with XRE-family HTH domain
MLKFIFERRKPQMENMINENFARQLKRVRLLKGLTQEELAKKIDATQKAVYMWEKGRRTPKLSRISKIAEELGIPLKDLLGC